MKEHKYAVAVFIKSPQGIPLIRDPKKPIWCWKLPGGRSEAEEMPVKTAIREIAEETGLEIEEKNLQLAFEENRDNHVFVLFITELSSLKGIKTKGDENEEIKIFSLEQIKVMSNLFVNHKKILEQLKII